VCLRHVTLYSFVGSIAVLIAPSFLYGQYPCSCERDKPFIADSAEHIDMEFPDGSNHPLDSGGTLARDVNGRIYHESRPTSWVGNANAATGKNGPVGPDTRQRVHTIVSISDCTERKNITVFPEIKTAQVAMMPTPSVLQERNPSNRSYFETLAHVTRPSNSVLEDLDFREIGQIRAHGFKVTVIGIEDGEWKGQPTDISEYWVFDDLEVVILEIRTNLRGKNKSTITVSNIRREEPNPTLFQIPPDYTIRPPQEMHFPASNSEPEKRRTNPGGPSKPMPLSHS
jgi:hypothetical protein